MLSELEANIVIIVPFTSNMQALRFTNTIEVDPSSNNGLKSKSVALAFQLRAIDKRRLKNKIGMVDDKTLGKIDNIIKRMLNLN